MHTVRILVVPQGGVGVGIGLTKLGGVDVLARKLPVAYFVPDILQREDLPLGLIRWPFFSRPPVSVISAIPTTTGYSKAPCH